MFYTAARVETVAECEVLVFRKKRVLKQVKLGPVK